MLREKLRSTKITFYFYCFADFERMNEIPSNTKTGQLTRIVTNKALLARI